jgi:hypothetical protein
MLYSVLIVVKMLLIIVDRPLCREASKFLIVTMDSPQNKDTLFKYESLIEQYYEQPIHGKFEDIDMELDADKEVMRQSEDTEQAAVSADVE